jgi:hypothetical protein
LDALGAEEGVGPVGAIDVGAVGDGGLGEGAGCDGGGAVVAAENDVSGCCCGLGVMKSKVER